MLPPLLCVYFPSPLILLRPKDVDRVDVETDTLKEFYANLYQDLSVNAAENRDILRFFQKRPPNDLITARATAFQVACDFLGEDKETNVALLGCINAAVHSLESALYEPREFHLKAPQEDLSGLSLEQAVQKLWELDANRLESGDDYVINVQGGKKPYWKEDTATDPLFQSVDSEVWQRPTYKAFHTLLDNYSSEIGASESVSGAESREALAFLDAICQTAPMQFCHYYCRAKDPDRIPEDLAEFKTLLNKIWFELYRRGDTNEKDSSGFEHVFLGEVRDGEVTGFHNWIQFYFEEKKGELDYRGYLKPKSKNDAESNGNDHLLTLQFHWKGVEKFAGTFFVGVSPEFEMALYTMCFLIGEEENNVELDTGVDVFGLW